MSEFKKFPKPREDEKHLMWYDWIETQDWIQNTKQKLEKIKTDLNEILSSELMKQAKKFMPRVRDRWEGQLSIVEELLEAFK